MSRGWAIGTKAFKRAVVRDEERRLAALELGSKEYAELREEVWELELERCLGRLAKGDDDIVSGAKSADWKVAVAAFLKRRHLCSNPWLGSRLNMGAAATISRCCGELGKGRRPVARALFEELESEGNV